MQQCKVKYKIKTVESSCQILDNKRIPINEEEREIRKGNIPYYGANGLQGYINDYIFDDNLILLAEDGGYFDEYQTRPIAYKISGKSWVNNHAHILKPNTDYNFNYIFYNLEHKNILYYINGGTRAKLTQQELKNIKLILVDDIKQQEKIAQILSTCDSVIEKTEETIEKYKRIKAGMMQDLFTRGLDKNGKLRPKYQNAPELYKYSEELSRYIPKDWEVILLKNTINRIGDIDHYMPVSTEDGIPYIMTGDFTENNGLDFKNAKKISKFDFEKLSKKIKPEFDDIIIARYATVGEIRIVKTTRPFLVSYSCAIIKTNKNLLFPDFLAFYMQSEQFKYLIDLKTNTSTQKNIGIDILKNMFVFKQTISQEQKNISKYIKKINNKIEIEQQYLSKYKQIKQGLMKKLLTPPAEAEIVEE